MNPDKQDPVDPAISFELLKEETAKYRAWAATEAPKLKDADWEIWYEDWEYLYVAVKESLNAAPLNLWPQIAIDDLLYALARDSEDEWIVDYISERPQALFWIAEAQLDRAEPDAKWQIADRLGNSTTDFDRRAALLHRYINDADAYVRLRAQDALARLKADGV